MRIGRIQCDQVGTERHELAELGHDGAARWIDDEVRAKPLGHLLAHGHRLNHGEPSSTEFLRPLDPLDAVIGRAEHDDVVAQAKTRAPDLGAVRFPVGPFLIPLLVRGS